MGNVVKPFAATEAFPYFTRCLKSKAFTRSDVLVALISALLLLALTLPALCQAGVRSELAACFNNLRQIGGALQLWGNDHQGRFPWRVPVTEGGSMESGKSGNAWHEFFQVSKELGSPRILVCPSDSSTRVARDFSRDPAGGFLHFDYRANALSYFIALDTDPILFPLWLSGDRNIKVDGTGEACSSGVNNAATVTANFANPEAAQVSWTNSIHGEQGNILASDGSVAHLSTLGLRKSSAYADDNGRIHLLFPR